MSDAPQRAEMPGGSAPILEYRSLEKDYRTIIPLIKPGMRVLDIGCGPGAISRGVAERVGKEGSVVGIDSSEYLIGRGKSLLGETTNLELVHADLFAFEPREKFDLIMSARVLQWLANPKEALFKMKSLLKAGGTVSILDYNHNALDWQPEAPASMQQLYRAFLLWRSEAGMNNQIALDLAGYMEEAGYTSIKVLNADERYVTGADNFLPKIGIWTKVAQSRGQQLVRDGYLMEHERLKAIEEYEAWIHSDAKAMTMKLNEVRGQLS